MSRTRDVVMIHELARESNPFAEIVIDGIRVTSLHLSRFGTREWLW
jgi:hypothetical protein